MVVDSFKQLMTAAVAVLLTTVSMAQIINEGTIVYERRTNLMKRMGDNPRAAQMINDDNKIRKENFILHFTDSAAVYEYIEPEQEEEGFLKYFTQRHTVYENLKTDEKFWVLDMFGTKTNLSVPMQEREWMITESKREIAGYLCRKAMWEMNDSTRIYAWFSVDVAPSVGPEGFAGLPGAILGLATEDGGLVYFAKEVTAKELPEGKTDYSGIKGKVHSLEELRAILDEKMGRFIKPKDMDAMFAWF